MAKVVNTYDIPRLNSKHDTRYRYETVQPEVLGTRHMRGEIVIYPPGTAGASHYHEGTEHIFYITEGRGTFYVDDVPREVKAGDFSPSSAASGQSGTNRRSPVPVARRP